MKTGPQNPQTPREKRIAYLMWYSHLKLNHKERMLIRQLTSICQSNLLPLLYRQMIYFEQLIQEITSKLLLSANVKATIDQNVPLNF